MVYAALYIVQMPGITWRYTLLLNWKLLIRCKPFSPRDIFCAGRVTQEDLNRTVKACGGTILTTVNDIREADMGQCDLFEEVQIGNDRWVSEMREVSQWD